MTAVNCPKCGAPKWIAEDIQKAQCNKCKKEFSVNVKKAQ